MPHKLLLADDSVTIQRVIELTFADEDVHVIAVGDGKQAIDRLQQDRPDIVLADIGMPERDGYEVASFIKGNPQLAHIPVLLLTGAFEPIDETRARSVGCDGVLVKPFEPQMVINRVRDLLAGRKPAGLWAANPALQTPVRPSPAPIAAVEAQPSPSSSPAAGVPKAGTESLEDYFDRLDAAFGGKGEPASPAAPPPAAASSHAPESATVASQDDYGYREASPAPAAATPAAPAAPAAHGDVLGDWDPELTGDPVRAPIADAPSRAVVSVSVSTSNPPAAPPAAVAQPPAHRSEPVPFVQSPPAITTPPIAAAIAAVPPMPSLAEAFAALFAAEQGQPIAPSGHRIAAMSAPPITDQHIEAIARRVIDRMGDDSMRRAVLDVAERLVREEIDRIKGR